MMSEKVRRDPDLLGQPRRRTVGHRQRLSDPQAHGITKCSMHFGPLLKIH